MTTTQYMGLDGREAVSSEAMRARVLPCLLPGCGGRAELVSGGFCEPSHAAIYAALPEFCRGPRGLSILDHWGDLDLTTRIAERNQDALAACNVEYDRLYGGPKAARRRLAETAQASRGEPEGDE
jgi:hypothetical protein